MHANHTQATHAGASGAHAHQQQASPTHEPVGAGTGDSDGLNVPKVL